MRRHGVLCSSVAIVIISTVMSTFAFKFADAQIVRDEGEISLHAELAVGDTSGCAGPTQPCNGLLDVWDAEYHVFIRTHGPLIPELLDAQLRTFNGGCLTGQPNTGQCMNIQGSAFILR
jgi:hypothetical protein